MVAVEESQETGQVPMIVQPLHRYIKELIMILEMAPLSGPRLQTFHSVRVLSFHIVMWMFSPFSTVDLLLLPSSMFVKRPAELIQDQCNLKLSEPELWKKSLRPLNRGGSQRFRLMRFSWAEMLWNTGRIISSSLSHSFCLKILPNIVET